MTCTTITIVQIKPVVSNLVVTQRTDIQGQADVSWHQDIAGSVSLRVNNIQMGSATAGKAGNNYALLGSLAVDTHTVCVNPI